MENILEIKNLSLEFHKGNEVLEVLKNISFSLKKGETLGIVGESGSGKSVTGLSIMKLLPPNAKITHGDILFHGQSIRYASEKDMETIRGKKITMIFQEPMTSLNPVLTCGYQIEEMFLTHHKQKKSYKNEVIELLHEVQIDQPERVYKAYPHQISGGQKQRVMIAMAIATQPDLLIADEPTTALDATVQFSILELLKKLQAKYGMSMIFISHDLAVIKDICNQVVVMWNGKVMEKGSTHEILTNPQNAYTQALIKCRPKPNYYPERLLTLNDFLEIQNDQIIPKNPQPPQLMDKKLVSLQNTQKSEVLRIENLSVWYPYQKNFWGKVINWKKAVNEVSFSIKKGETLGLVGESGCGKSTIAKTLVQLIQPTYGEIFFQGIPLCKMNSKQNTEYKKKVQMIFQDPYSSLNPRMKIGEAIMEPMVYHQIYSSKSDCKEQTFILLEKVGLKKEHFDRYPHEFSGGQRQRICIARALALKPEILICDESVSALDVSVQAQVLNLLNDLKQEFELSFLFISHDLNVVQYFCDRILVMYQGRIVEEGFTHEIMINPKESYTQKLMNSVLSI